MKTTSARPCSRRTLEQSLVVLGTGALAAGPAVLSLAPGVSAASGHREAPMTSGDPWADKTSLYAFTSPARSDTVTLVANFADLRLFDLLYGGELSERGQDTLAGYKDADPGQIFPAEEPRLGMIVAPAKKPQRLGVLAGDLAGFPNGRRPVDDAIDISLQAVEGAAQTGKLVPAPAAGDKANTTTSAWARPCRTWRSRAPRSRAGRTGRPTPTRRPPYWTPSTPWPSAAWAHFCLAPAVSVCGAAGTPAPAERVVG